MNSIDNSKFFASTGLIFSSKPIKRRRDFAIDLGLISSLQPIKRRYGFMGDYLLCVGNSFDSPMTNAKADEIAEHLLKLEAKHIKPTKSEPPAKPTTSYPLKPNLPNYHIKYYENRMLAKFGLKESDLLYIDQD